MSKPDQIKILRGDEKFFREGRFVPRARDAEGEDDRIRELSFASEEPYERWFGIEILDHSPGAADLSRLNNAGPLLLYHSPTTPVGVIEKAWLDKSERKSRALVRFGKGATAADALRDVDDGILTHASFRYLPNEMVLEEEKKGQLPVYRVTKWLALEVSLVTVAADDTVGVGRCADLDEPEPTVTHERMEPMKPQNDNTQSTLPAAAPVPVDVKAERDAGVKAERSRIKMINAHANVAANIFENAREVAETFIAEGRSYEEFTDQLPILGKRKAASNVQPALGLSDADSRGLAQYRMMDIIRYIAQPHERSLRDKVGHQLELSQEACRQYGLTTKGVIVPFEAMARTLAASSANSGANMVPSEHRGDMFVDFLRSRARCVEAGAQVLTDLSGKVDIPTGAVVAEATWVGEGNAASESTQEVGQIPLDAESLSAWSEYTDKLLRQSSPSVELFVVNDLMGACAVALDKAGLHGTGQSNQPTGIAATSGIGSVPIGATGGAPTWAHILKLEEEVAIDNADIGKVAYMTNPKVRRKLKETPRVASTDSRMIWEVDSTIFQGTLNGYRGFVTNQVRSDLTKSSGENLSAIFFGNWEDLIFALWGGVELLIDPYSNSTAGKTRVVARLLADVGVRRAVSFAAVLDASTA